MKITRNILFVGRIFLVVDRIQKRNIYLGFVPNLSEYIYFLENCKIDLQRFFGEN